MNRITDAIVASAVQHWLNTPNAQETLQQIVEGIIGVGIDGAPQLSYLEIQTMNNIALYFSGRIGQWYSTT